jgi:MoaA/NifB/PqqE/SkfB family radical SAM enzyme
MTVSNPAGRSLAPAPRLPGQPEPAGNPLAGQVRRDLPGRFNELDLLHRERSRVAGVLAGEVLPPYEVLIHPSSACNLRCTWCIGDHVPVTDGLVVLDAAKTAPHVLPSVLADPEAMLGVLAGIASYRRARPDGTELVVEAVSFSGLIGEPLMSRAAVTAGLHFLADRGLRAGLFTNGVLMDGPVREALARSAYVHVSMDAGTPGSYALLKSGQGPAGQRKFSAALENLARLSALRAATPGSRLAVNGSFILYPENYAEVYDAARLLRDAGVDTMRVKRDISGKRLLSPAQAAHAADLIAAIRSDLADGDFHLVEVHHAGLPADLARHFTACRITRLMAAVGADGNLYPCNYHPRPGGHSYGPATGGRFAETWEGSARAGIAARLPRICPPVCDPFKTRANALLETAGQVARTEGTERLFEYVDELIAAGAYGPDRDTASGIVPAVPTGA